MTVKRLRKIYDNSICIFNDGNYYNFFTTFKRKPIKVFLGLDSEFERHAINNGIEYINEYEVDLIQQWIKEDGKIFKYAVFPSEEEQIKIEGNGLKIKDCWSFKMKKGEEELFSDDRMNYSDELPDMRKKVKEYIGELGEEINRYVDLGEINVDGEDCEMIALKARIQTLEEVRGDLTSRLEELV